MNIDISNAHCGPRIQFPDHAWLRVVLVPRNCLRLCAPGQRGPFAQTAYERSLDVRPRRAVPRGGPLASSEITPRKRKSESSARTRVKIRALERARARRLSKESEGIRIRRTHVASSLSRGLPVRQRALAPLTRVARHLPRKR